MRCWHIQRPITPVPIQPTRVFPGSAFARPMMASCSPVRGEVSFPPSRTVHELFTLNRQTIMPAEGARAPIVLVPGLLGFDRVTVGPYTVARYFPGIEEVLTEAGYRVATAKPSLTAGVAHRAAQLRDYIVTRFPAEPVHIVAHSIGGLDARYMLTCLGMQDRVRSLTTIGTPHRGSTFADWAIGRFSRLLKPILAYFRIRTDGFQDLTTERCARFNDLVPDVPGVSYH